MKTITIQNRTLYYQIIHAGSEYGDSSITEFYAGSETFWRRKYLFGKKELLSRPKLVFTLWINIEDASYTKKTLEKK